MHSITLTIPPHVDINTDEGLRSVREANPHLAIERVGADQVSITQSSRIPQLYQ